jgi:hypothetical protein
LRIIDRGLYSAIRYLQSAISNHQSKISNQKSIKNIWGRRYLLPATASPR